MRQIRETESAVPANSAQVGGGVQGLGGSTGEPPVPSQAQRRKMRLRTIRAVLSDKPLKRNLPASM